MKASEAAKTARLAREATERQKLEELRVSREKFVEETVSAGRDAIDEAAANGDNIATITFTLADKVDLLAIRDVEDIFRKDGYVATYSHGHDYDRLYLEFWENHEQT